MTAPLPPLAADPSIVRGQQIRPEYTARVQAVRLDVTLDPIVACESVILAWDTANTELTSLYQDLQARRRARLDVLESVVPVGPPVTAEMSMADATVINQAFRAALSDARAALPPAEQFSSTITPLRPATGTLAGMLSDAEKFDDDVLRRAVLTAAFEDGRTDLVRRWTDMAGVTEQFDELGDLRQAVAGEGVAGQWNFTVFSKIAQPDEVDALASLVDARVAARQAQIGQARIAQRVANANPYFS